MKYTNDLRAFVVKCYDHGYKIHHFTRAFKISTGSIWRWITAARGKLVYRRLKIDGLRQQKHDKHLVSLFHNFRRWQIYALVHGGDIDIDRVCKGERPP